MKPCWRRRSGTIVFANHSIATSCSCPIPFADEGYRRHYVDSIDSRQIGPGQIK